MFVFNYQWSIIDSSAARGPASPDGFLLHPHKNTAYSIRPALRTSSIIPRNLKRDVAIFVSSDKVFRNDLLY